MKTFFGAFLLGTLLLASTAQAIVADNFVCDAKILRDGKEISKMKLPRAYALRWPEGTTVPGLTLTTSKAWFELEVPDEAKVQFILSYQHAVSHDADGKAIAAQYLCAQGSMHSGPSSLDSACEVPTSDPFAAGSDWDRTTIKDGVPVFDETALHTWSVSLRVPDHTYEAQVDCGYCGTDH